jgi:multiple sugar transport system permease protein
MTAPALFGIGFFILVPFLLALFLSFTTLRLGSPLPLEFAGLTQYRLILEDPAFQRALLNNLVFLAVVVPVQTVLALGLAVFLNVRLKGMTLFRTLFFMPVVFPMSLIAVIWVLIYAPGPDGMMNAFLGFVTFGAWEARDFLHNPYLALPAVMLLSIWQGVGFQMVILLAGLQGIDQRLYDAAAIDGAGRVSRFFHVTLPGLRNPLIFVVIVTSILSFRVFDQVRIMTRGGPQNASTTVVYEMIQAGFDRAQVARGAAMAVVFFLIVLAITLVQRALFKQEEQR